MEWKIVELINLAQNRGNWRVVVNTLISLLIS